MVFTIPSEGALTQFGFDSVNPVTKVYEFNTYDFGARPEFLETGGIRGILDHISENVVEGRIPVNGNISLEPTPTVLSTLLLQAILCGTPTGTSPMTYPLGNTAPYNFIQVDRLGKVFTYAGVAVNRARFHSAEGRQLVLDLELAGKTETIGNSGTFPAALTPPLEAPFMHFNGTFTLNGLARQVREVSIEIDNHLTVDRYMNSQTVTDLVIQDRTIAVNVTVPYNADNVDLYAAAVTAATGATFVWVNGSKTLTFTVGALQQAAMPAPPIQGKTELLLTIPFFARKLSTTPALSVSM